MLQCQKCLYSSNVYPQIQLDEQGVCDVCRVYKNLAARTVLSPDKAKDRLNRFIHNVKAEGEGKPHDCIVGVSGGVDSSYIAYLTKEWGLRPLVLHVDNGWNSELAVDNIQRLIQALDFDLYTEVLDWNQMRDLQLASFKSSVLDIDLPFDNAFMAVLYRLAAKMKIKYIISGHNTLTEGWMPPSFCHYKLDTLNIKAIHKRYGKVSLRSFPMIGPLGISYYKKIQGIEMVSPLDWMDYNKAEVKTFLQHELGWRDYGGKHYENIFTKFYQGYILPEKFKIDKRISHLSTLICSGQISKEEALLELSKPQYDQDELRKDRLFFFRKMGLTEDEFEAIMNHPPVAHTDFPSYLNIFKRLSKVKKAIKFW